MWRSPLPAHSVQYKPTASLETDPWVCKTLNFETLLDLLLLLLTDADLEMLLLGFLVSLVIVTCDHIFQICVDIGVLRQNRHHREILIASGAKRAKALHVWDCHEPKIA